MDIIALSSSGNILSIVEVRSTANSAAHPLQTVGHNKRRCMLRAARQLQSVARRYQCKLRVDVIEVKIGDRPAKIVHHEGILGTYACD